MKRKRRIIPYNPELKQLARQLRNHSTLGEVLLWRKLRAGQFMGYNFHRQKPLLSFIVDFYCPKLELVLEIDGNSHKRSDVSANDAEKEVALSSYGLGVLRFTERQVRFDIESVLRQLEFYVNWYREHKEINDRSIPSKKRGAEGGVCKESELHSPTTSKPRLHRSQAVVSPLKEGTVSGNYLKAES